METNARTKNYMGQEEQSKREGSRFFQSSWVLMNPVRPNLMETETKKQHSGKNLPRGSDLARLTGPNFAVTQRPDQLRPENDTKAIATVIRQPAARPTMCPDGQSDSVKKKV